MCQECYEEHGSPKIVNVATLAAADLIAEVYEFSNVGGHAHIVVDDYNLEDRHIQWCLDEAVGINMFNVCQEQLDAETACLNALMALNMDERYSALAIYDGYLEV